MYEWRWKNVINKKCGTLIIILWYDDGRLATSSRLKAVEMNDIVL